jgi:hypothetical protein
MSIKAKITENVQQLLDTLEQSLNDTPAYQTLKAKYDELDQRSKESAKVGAVLVVALIGISLLFSASSRVNQLKADLEEKNDLVRLLQDSNDELRQLKDAAAAAGMFGSAEDQKQAATAWNSHFESLANNTGVPKESLSIGGEKPGASGEQTRESLIDITIKKINVRQLSRFANALESGSKPVKIRAMTIDSKPDGSAWLDVTLSLSAFSMKPGQ